MALDLAAFQSTLNRPNDPHDPTGIAHATDSADTGDGAATKAARATAKLAWANYVQDYKQALIVGDSSGPSEFPDNGEIIYADDIGSFTNPTLTIGSAVTTSAVSPFAGGGNSYNFISSVNSYIQAPASADWAMGTGDFTVEWFSNQTTLTQFQRIFTVGDYPAIDFGVSIESGTFYYWSGGDADFEYSSASATTTNTWYHWAVVRQSGTVSVYRNGTLRGSSFSNSDNINDVATPFVVGNTNTYATNAALVGALTNFRLVKGLAVYTGNFTVPTSALTATASANPYGGSNTSAIPSGATKLLLVP